MREAVIVSTARTAIGRAFRGALNNIRMPSQSRQYSAWHANASFNSHRSFARQIPRGRE